MAAAMTKEMTTDDFCLSTTGLAAPCVTQSETKIVWGHLQFDSVLATAHETQTAHILYD